MQQVTIYREARRFAGWPANYGIWHWGEEIVVGFAQGYHATQRTLHSRDTSRPFTNMQARSTDGGLSWTVEDFPGKRPGNRGLSADEHMDAGLRLAEVLDGEDAPSDPPGDVDFLNPDFTLMCARTGLKAGTCSFFYVSYDRCRSWHGPYQLPMFEQTAIAARTDYIVEAHNRCLLFLTANKRDGNEGRAFCGRTQDGARTFDFVSYIGDEPRDVKAFSIMPASLMLPDGRILCALRCRGDDTSTWIDLYVSEDAAQTWCYLTRPVDFGPGSRNGNPPTLSQLPDGRLLLVYGNRAVPYAIAARLSDDAGQSWGDEIRLRGNAGSPDLGYPRTAVLPDGKVVTVYYFNDRPDDDGERFIEATIWQP